jgi:hypothetical protein
VQNIAVEVRCVKVREGLGEGSLDLGRNRGRRVVRERFGSCVPADGGISRSSIPHKSHAKMIFYALGL